jgi:hypothetical protein
VIETQDVYNAGVPEGGATDLAMNLAKEMSERGVSDGAVVKRIMEILENPSEGFLSGPWEAQMFAREIWDLKRTGRFTTEGT